MLRLSDIRIRPKLIMIFFLAGFIPLLIVGLFATRLATDSLMEKSFNQLLAVQDIRKSNLEEFFHSTFADIHVLAESGRVHSLIQTLQSLKELQQAKGQRMNIGTAAYNDSMRQFQRPLKHFAAAYGYHDLFVIDAEKGDVLFSVAGEDDLGSNLVRGSLHTSGLAQAWRQVLESGETAIADFHAYEPSNGMQAAFIAEPVFDAAGDIIAVLALQLTDKQVTMAVDSRQGMGETGESYLFGVYDEGKHFEFRSNLHTIGDGNFVVGHAVAPLDYWLDAVKDDLDGGYNTYVDSAGNEVLVAYIS